MDSSAVIELIESHTEELTGEALRGLLMHPRTPSFRGVPREEITARIGTLYGHLGRWIATQDDDAIRAAFEDWGRKRFSQNVPISELVYAVILAKGHLRRRARDQGLADLQAVEAAIGDFFDRALYYLVRGYEMQAATPPRATAGASA